jgi:ACS family hexuronate transporter-like MFS transporter
MATAIRNLRWYIGGLLCLSTALNYLDRQTLSVLAVTVQHDLKISDQEYSWVTSSFLLAYTVMYLVTGHIVDRIGPRRAFTVSVTGWSISNICHAMASTAAQLAGFRFALGFFESANYPAGVRAVAEWFPMKERALGMGIFNSGSAIGGAIAVPLVSIVALRWGWRMAFVITGAVGFFWVLGWVRLYESPGLHRRLGPEERDHILSGETPIQDEARASLGELLRMKETWGCIGIRIMTDPITYFMNFWIPKYLQQQHGFSLAALGLYAWIPFLGLTIGNLVGGAIPYRLVSRGWSVNRARKTTMLIDSCLIFVCFLLLLRPATPLIAVGIITVLMFGHGAWGNITVPAEVFPKSVLGTISGLGGTIGGAAGIVTQLVIGWAVQHFSYKPLFPICGVMYLAAFFIMHFMVGELGKIRELRTSCRETVIRS